MVFAIILIVVAVYIILESLLNVWVQAMGAGHILFLIKGINLSLMASCYSL